MGQEAVAIVTGGSFPTGRRVARGLAGWGWAIVVVYLEHQRTVEATVVEILATDGRIVAVRADLADDLDVLRLFAESRAAFGDVAVVVHTMTARAPLLLRHGAQHVNPGGIIVTAAVGDQVDPVVARQFRERGITVDTTSPDEILIFLDRWRRR
ncbi:SDR family NAD(P)-dependent oxidoreductase [Solirubrobacter ginsenosidimutans]|uniref:SDR family NAD(P)-dependent oxidoreductase n=1 Tax=Solirubrobacter ginsenosidimutans TaxID=490573 RepID=A0A9X3RY69_9ACTN|nr:SDR family NAD(P)-dependent oxidoreductase [Solirubrobacter ginsenosidimutans]MDA0158864.1 SDR family NAD(P)-dependent oxidoreductase [Solirubrobacter ginsenosidimutans]